MAGFVQNGQRPLAAIDAERTTCQTLQTPGCPTHPLKFRQLTQRDGAEAMGDS